MGGRRLCLCPVLPRCTCNPPPPPASHPAPAACTSPQLGISLNFNQVYGWINYYPSIEPAYISQILFPRDFAAQVRS